ncbi:cytochrome P450 [Gigaspora rosea]|uniref:Cytochrome P450 n=1 Tax=Gigaspora rosea TaxID=44941 RepID=A0A397UX68_9GLOM|nr:cytochrome P450 [Gigaspora rosea]
MTYWLYLIFIIFNLLFYFICRVNKPPKELDFIPTVSFFKDILILLRNGGQLETQNLFRECDPNKIGLVKHYFFGWTIHITNIEYAKLFLSESAHNIPKTEMPPKTPLSIFYGKKGILVSNGDRWMQQRKIASLAFNRTLRPDMVVECTNEFITLLNKWTDTPIDILSLSKRLTIQILGKLAFAYDMKALDSLEEQPYFLDIYNKIFQHVNNPFFMIFPFLNLLALKRNIEFSSLIKEFNKFILKMIEQRRLELSKEKNENENTDLLSGLLEAANHEEYNYTNKELRDHLVNYLIAGYDTTSTSISIILYYLAKYPDIQKKARDEVIKVLGSASNFITSENLKDLKYLTAIIMESLRLYPPAALLVYRKPTKPFNLSENITIPKGISVTVNFWQIHRNPDIWNDADKFIPERFINPTKEIENNWIPFSIGPRNCLGQNFSMMEQKVVIALTLLNFEMSFPPNAKHLDEIPLTKNFLLQPKKIDLIFSKLK